MQLKNEYESDLFSNEHYLNSSENLGHVRDSNPEFMKMRPEKIQAGTGFEPRGHGFESHKGLNSFQALISLLLK